MAIKYTKKAYLWPFSFPLLVFRLQNIEYDGYTVFIIFSDDTLIGICSISLNDSTLFIRGFSNFMILKLESFRVKRNWILTKE